MTIGERDAGLGFTATIVVPALLIVDVLMGGAHLGAPLQAAALQILGCFVIAWCLIESRMRPLGSASLVLIAIVVAAGAYCMLQVVPLPHEVWTSMPGRESAVEAFRIAGIGDVSQPLSLRVDRTLYGTMYLLPPLAILVLVAKTPWRVAGRVLPWTIVALGVVSALLGVAQTFFSDQAVLFPYGDPPGHGAPGIFQSPNHQTTLQLMALPFVGMLFARIRNKIGTGDAYQGYALALVIACVLLVTGVFLAGSFAGIALLVPVLAAGAILASGGRSFWYLVLALLFVTVCAVAIGYLSYTSPWLPDLGITDFSDGPLGRRKVFELSWEIAKDQFPWGSGLGAFENVFPSYENPETITPTFINHVHNDYIEVLLELGIVGGLALVGVVGWWIVMTARAWRSGTEENGALKQAASLALGVVILHSMVDFPIRTETIACLAAVCAGLMSRGQWGGERRFENLRDNAPFQHRHVEL